MSKLTPIKDLISSTMRVVAETSTSVLLGATLNVAKFQGQQIRAGMARRFIYYLGLRMRKLIVLPVAPDEVKYNEILNGFKRMGKLSGEITFSSDAMKLWVEFQKSNRDAQETASYVEESYISRLGSAPMQVLKTAMIFEICIWAKCSEERFSYQISEGSLSKAIEHINACMDAANYIDRIADEQVIEDQAEVIMESIREDSMTQSYDGIRFYTRTELTKRFCAHPGRQGNYDAAYFYGSVMSCLRGSKQVALVQKKGKLEIYAFLAIEEDFYPRENGENGEKII